MNFCLPFGVIRFCISGFSGTKKKKFTSEMCFCSTLLRDALMSKGATIIFVFAGY